MRFTRTQDYEQYEKQIPGDSKRIIHFFNQVKN